MLRLLIDTSVWLDIAKRRDGQQVIVPLRVLMFQGKLQLLVPPLVQDEFDRNRPRAEVATTSSVRERFRLLRQDLQDYGDEGAQQWIAEMAHQIPFVSALSLQNFSEISELLRNGVSVEASDADRAAVIDRALGKLAPFHLNKNSVADALLIEIYGSALSADSASQDDYVFATANYQDFSAPGGDRRRPHPDIADKFDQQNSHYAYGVDGLTAALAERLGSDFVEGAEEVAFLQEGDRVRSLRQILDAHEELTEKIWYIYSVSSDTEDGKFASHIPEEIRDGILEKRSALEERYGSDLMPVDAVQWGMMNGKLSALRWVLGDEWDFLDF